MDKFKSKFLEIREEVKDLLPNNEGVIDAVIAPVFFVVLANFVDLNTAIFSTGGLLIVFLIYRRLRKQDLKIFKLKNDIKYNYKKIYLSVGHILEYNRFYKILNKVVKDKQKIIDWKNFKKISQNHI